MRNHKIVIELFDYAGKDPIGEVRAWRDRLQVAQQAQLDQKLDVLARADNEMLPGLIAGPLRVKGVKYPHIYKLQIGGKVRLRPLLCRGPFDADKEITLLVGATERDGKFDPAGAPDQAVVRREEIKNDARLRKSYEFPEEPAD
jgi:hypothetical protein